MTSSGKIELMAPAGNFESLQAALDNGADSVYFGVEQLNMRARASINFTIDDLPEIAARCKVKNVRTYLTLNTIIYDHDLSIIKTLLGCCQDRRYYCCYSYGSSGYSLCKTNRDGDSYFYSNKHHQYRDREILCSFC